jgi:hypothetical protein
MTHTKEQAAALLRLLGDEFEKRLAETSSWSDHPESDFGEAIWGKCVRQVNNWVWRRSGNVVFKLGATKEEDRAPFASRVLRRDVFDVEIVIGAEAWELGRAERTVYDDKTFRAGPWWEWLETFVADLDNRIAAQKQRRMNEKQTQANRSSKFEASLRDTWTP